MTADPERPSPRRDELLERAYAYVLEHGLGGMSLRPLAAATGTSPRVLLFLFGSKEELVRALLARARRDELAALAALGDTTGPAHATDPHTVLRTTWRWLADPAHRPLLALWTEAYARSLTEPEGPWGGFARQTVEDWLGLLSRPAARTATDRTLALAVLRGLLLDVLATGDVERTTAALERHLGAR